MTNSIYIPPSSGGNMEIGNPVIGADSQRILFVDNDDNLGQSDDLTFTGVLVNSRGFVAIDDGAGFTAYNEDQSRAVTIVPNSSRINYIDEDLDETNLIFPSAGSNNITLPQGDGTLILDTLLGAAEGIATLDSGGKVPLGQLPFSVAEYKGAWNASTNTPTLADGVGDNGDFYAVSVGGTQDLGSGSIVFAAGNLVIYNGDTNIWEKVGGLATGTVTMVTSADNAKATVINGSSTPEIDIVSAPKLTTAITINNVSFDGSTNILLNQSINAQNGTTYTFQAADNQKLTTASNTSPQIYTIPPGMSIGAQFDLFTLGTGSVTFAEGSGVTIRSYLGRRTVAGQYIGVTAKHLGSNVYALMGNLV